MKVKFASILVLAALFFAPSAFAQTSTPSASVRPIPKREIRQNIEAKREEVRDRISSIRKANIRKYFGNMVTRLEALVTRLEKLSVLIENRIAKIKGEGNSDIDTSSAEKSLSEAKLKIIQAKTDISKLKADMESALSSQAPKEAFKTVRESLTKIKDELKEAHRLLVHSIGELKGLRVGDEK